MINTIENFWCETYRRKRGAKYVGFQKRDGVILRKLLAEYGEKNLRYLIGKYLEIEDDPFLRHQGWDTRCLQTRVRGLYVEMVKRYGEQEVEQAKETRERVRAVADSGKVASLLDRIGRPA